MNGYTVVIKKFNGKESNKFIPMFIDKEDYERQTIEDTGDILKYGIKKLEEKLNK